MSARIIKFRAWGGSGFHYWGENLIGKNTFTGSPNPTYPNTQFTGLYDKRGCEIFEGDIIRLDGDGDVECEITFHDGSFHMIMAEGQGRSPAIQMRVCKFTVVGNIFESRIRGNNGL